MAEIKQRGDATQEAIAGLLWTGAFAWSAYCCRAMTGGGRPLDGCADACYRPPTAGCWSAALAPSAGFVLPLP